jgi:hypothetical protein
MTGSQFFGNTLEAPRWAGDFLDRVHLEPYPAKIDYTTFTDSVGIPVQVTAAATQGATSITVSALQPSLYPATSIIASGNVLLPNGTVLSFGSGKFAQLTADASVGATTLTVAALPTALTGSESTVFSKYGTETIPSGSIVSRTIAQRDAASPWHAAIATDADIRLVAFDLPNAKVDAVAALYKPGSRVKENYLPGYSTVLRPGGTDSSLMTALRAIYECYPGTD